MKSPNDSGPSRLQIAIIAPEITRSDPEGAFMRFLRDNASILRSRFLIIATRGTADTIIQTGYFEKDEHICPLRPGARGGIVEVAYKVVTGECGVVIFLYDPEEVRSESPETRALTRVCIHKQITLLTTIEAADHWVKSQAEEYQPPTVSDWLEGKKGGGEGSFRSLGVEGSTIALISHDAKKKEMQRFVTKPDVASFLTRFRRVLATGTTGALIKGWSSDSYPELAKNVVLASSGPEGGDVQIAHEILNRRCQVVIFLHDPSTAHAHDPDINLLRRTCQIPGVETILLSDLLSAMNWVRTASSASKPPPWAEQLRTKSWGRNKFKLKEVLVVPADRVGEALESQKGILSSGEHGWGRTDDEWRAHREQWTKVVSELARVAAPYMDAVLRQQSDEKEIVIAVSWGPTMALLAEAIEQIKPLPIKNLVVIPLTGVPGAIYDEYNPNHIAGRIAKAYAGKSIRMDAPMFTRQGDPLAPQQKETLSKTRLVLTSIGPIPRIEGFAKEVTFAQDPSVWEGVALAAIAHESVGVIGPTLIDREGNAVVVAYKAVGLQYDDLKRIAQEGRVIFVVGGDERRYPAIKAALDGGLCSVLITEPETAENLLTLTECGTSANSG